MCAYVAQWIYIYLYAQPSASLTKTSCYAEDRDENRSTAQNQVNNNNINNSIEARNLSGHRHCSLLASFLLILYSFFTMDSSFRALSSSREVAFSSSSSVSIASSNLRYIEMNNGILFLSSTCKNCCRSYFSFIWSVLPIYI